MSFLPTQEQLKWLRDKRNNAIRKLAAETEAAGYPVALSGANPRTSIALREEGMSVGMTDDLQSFVDVMIEKLEKNKHKDALDPPDLAKLMRLALTEIGEVMEQILRDQASPNMVRECADAANFMFLVARHIQGKINDANRV